MGSGEWREENMGSVGEKYWVGKGQKIKERLKEWLLVPREELSCLEVIDFGCLLLILEVNTL